MANNTQLATDTFASGSLAAGWSALNGQVVSQVTGSPFVAEPPNTSVGGYQVWTGLTWPSDQCSEIVTTTTSEAASVVVLLLRTASTGGTYNGYQANIVNGGITIYRIDAGVATSLKTASVTMGTKDVWSFQVAGSVLSLYQNFNQRAYIADTTYTNGSPGFGQSSSSAVTHSQVFAWRGYSAVQQDGIWAKQGIVLPLTTADIANSGFGVQQPMILLDTNPVILTGNANVYKMWFSPGGTNALNLMSVSYAESLDGVTWTRYSSNPVLASFCNPVVVKSAGTYHMYVQSSNAFGTGGIAHYTSSDGITWTQQSSAVISPGSVGQWDNTSFGMVTAPIFANGQWNMLYCGEVNGGGTPNMGLATSPDLATWTKYASNPVLTNSVGGAIAKVGNTVYLWSAVGPSSSMGNGTLDPAETVRVQSTDLINWTNRVHSIHHSELFESVNSNHGNATASTIIDINGKAHLYYVGAPNDAAAPQYYQHALAIAPVPISSVVGFAEDAAPQIATDNFNRANGSLGANWTTPTGGTAQQIVSNKVESTVINQYNASFYSGASFGNDQYAEITIGTLAASNYMGPAVRMQSGSNSGYVAQINGPTGSSNTTAILLVMTNGATANIATTFGTVTTTPTVGDIWRLSIVGNVLTLYQNGTVILQGQDVNNTYTTGSPGMFNYAGTLANTQISNWSGGNANVIPSYSNVAGTGSTVTAPIAAAMTDANGIFQMSGVTVGSFYRGPVAITFTDPTGKSVTLTGTTVGSELSGPRAVVLCNSAGFALNGTFTFVAGNSTISITQTTGSVVSNPLPIVLTNTAGQEITTNVPTGAFIGGPTAVTLTDSRGYSLTLS